ncbi:MAG: hypothetical protein JKY95_14070 [Planctomycetaceae bacterium]|nr:hypothetical protein [Planctomycetaceae bacterium]
MKQTPNVCAPVELIEVPFKGDSLGEAKRTFQPVLRNLSLSQACGHHVNRPVILILLQSPLNDQFSTKRTWGLLLKDYV